uniref:Putative secreted protein n=1 Tax=Anopheles darlingi TaxID=43151 RepID=A0A2M4D3K2_ANODA
MLCTTFLYFSLLISIVLQLTSTHTRMHTHTHSLPHSSFLTHSRTNTHTHAPRWENLNFLIPPLDLEQNPVN